MTGEDVWVLVTELVEGCSLREHLARSGPLDLDELYDFGTQLLWALTAIHPDETRIAELEHRVAEGGCDSETFALLTELEQGGLVHRDIKPDNIMVRPDGTLVLVDFGISSRAGSTMATMRGTLGYWPPDLLIAAVDHWDPDVDRYAVGATLFEAACDALPYTGVDRATEVVDPAALGIVLPELVRGFLAKACWPDKAGRFHSTVEMYDVWQAVWQLPHVPPAPVASAFSPWAVRSVPPLDQLDDEQVRDLVLEIVAAESPMLVSRIYNLIRDASGTRPTARLNRLVHRMVSRWNGRLAQLEPVGGGQQDKTVYIAGTDPHVFRTLGGRAVHELPLVEIEAHLRQARRTLRVAEGQDGDTDRVVMAAVASLVPDGTPPECQYLADFVRLRL